MLAHMPPDRTLVWYSGDVAEQVTETTEVPLERLEAQICEGGALPAAITLGRMF